MVLLDAPEEAVRLSLILEGKMVSGKNAIVVTRSGMHFPKPRFKAWRDDMTRQVMEQKPKAVLFDGPVQTYIEYTPGDRIRRDCTGIMDALWHLAGIKWGAIVQDDSQFKAVVWREMPMDRDNPRVVWVIEDL